MSNEMIDLVRVKRYLEQQICKIHLEKPVVSVVGTSLKIKTCCKTSEEELKIKAEKEMGKQLQENIDDMLKGIGM